jgi:hypothetical protein
MSQILCYEAGSGVPIILMTDTLQRNGDTISMDLESIWGMSVHLKMTRFFGFQHWEHTEN